MSKTVYLMRHAKSSWKKPVSDRERPLNKRGKRAAFLIGEALSEKEVKIDRVFSSTARRARSTAKRVLRAMNRPVELLTLDPALYQTDAKKLLERIKELEDRFDSVLIIGHNPAISDTAVLLSGESRFDWLPTAGVVGIRFEVESWRRIAPGEGKAVLELFPKRLR